MTSDAPRERESGSDLEPFPGLRSFESHESSLFFGRDRYVDFLLGRLRGSRLVAVVGTSGSGKSSLVRSGLIPALLDGALGADTSRWRIVLMRPGDDPAGSMAEALEAAGGPSALSEWATSSLGPAENLLLVVDQFEEVFRFRDREDPDAGHLAEDFVQSILEAVGSEVPIYVVVTIRSESIGECTEYAGLAEALNEGQFLLPRMTEAERREAIVGPIAECNGSITPRLVDQLLDDVGEEPDQLPVLQHAMMRTWQHWREHHLPSEPLDLRHYESVGGVKDALSRHAEEVYRDLGSDRQVIAEKLLKALTEKRSKTGWGGRRPQTVQALCEVSGVEESHVVDVVDQFRVEGCNFLMPPQPTALGPDTVVDISHESLMRVWPRLTKWVDEEARSADVYRSLSQSAHEWKEKTGSLLKDPRLQLALDWRDDAKPSLAWAARYGPAYELVMVYLQHSEGQREIEDRDRERRRKTVLMGLSGVAVLLSLFAVVALRFGVVAEVRRVTAEAAQSTADSARSVAVSERLAADSARGVAISERLAADSARTVAVSEGLAADAARTVAVSERLAADSARTVAVSERLAADSARAVAVEERTRSEGLRAVADTLREEAERQRLLSGAQALAAAARANRERSEIGAVFALQAYRLHTSLDGHPREPIIFDGVRQTLAQFTPPPLVARTWHSDAVRALAVSPDGRLLASSGDDRRIVVSVLEPVSPTAGSGADGEAGSGLDVAGCALPASEPTCVVHEAVAEIRALIFDPSGDRLVAGTRDGSVLVLDVRDANAAAVRRTSISDRVASLAFDRDGRLVIGGANGIWRWDLSRDGPELVVDREVYALAMRPDGGAIVSTDGRDGVTMWTDLTGDPRDVYLSGEPRALAVSPGGRLATGMADGRIVLDEEPRTELEGHTAGITALTFLSDSLLLSGSFDRSVRLWYGASRDGTSRDWQSIKPIVFDEPDDWVLAVTASGGTIFAGLANGQLRSWDSDPGRLQRDLCAAVGADERIRSSVGSTWWTSEELLVQAGEIVPASSFAQNPCDGS